MGSIEEKETANLKLCHACNVEVRQITDKYCRRCGARQIHDTDRLFDDTMDPYITTSDQPSPLQHIPTAHVAFEKMRRRLFSLLGSES